MLGSELGHFRITGRLGAGGMGEVYRAEDPKLGREVAIKVLPESLANDPQALARFDREAKAVAALSHPNILSIYDLGQEGDVVYAVMELLEGETLRDRLTGGALPTRKALSYAARIAQGLAAAHSKGIVHRDLKPDNVFLTRDGQVKILDFGLARVLPEFDGETLTMAAEEGTRPGTVLGTVGYMSPEQVRGQEADERSDIFSLGVLLYEMLSGERAFRGDSPVETMSAILKQDPPELSATGRDLPNGVDRVVRHCLEKNPEERFQSARDLAFDLESLDGSAVSRATFDTKPPRSRRSPSLSAGWLALLVATPLAFYLGLNRQAPLEGGTTDFENAQFLYLPIQREIVFNARYEPDGETVLYSATDSGTEPQLLRLRHGRVEQLLEEPAHLLSISRQGEIALLLEPRFINHRIFEGTLARLPLSGGAPRAILEGVREADWSPDGEEMAIIRDRAGVDSLEYPIGNVLLTTPGYLSDLRISPDGERVAVLTHPIRFDNAGRLTVFDREGGTIEAPSAFYATDGVAWGPSGEEVYYGYAKSSDGGTAVGALSLGGEHRVAYASPNFFLADVSISGRWLGLVPDLRPELFARAPESDRDLNVSWGPWPALPVISRDGRQLAFADQGSDGTSQYRVLLRSTAGSPIVDLGPGVPQDFSPDGRWVLAAANLDPEQELVLHPTGPGESRVLPTPGLGFSFQNYFTPQGDVLTCKPFADQPIRCYVVPVEGGEIVAVTPENTKIAAASPDGQWFAAQSTADGTVALYPAPGHEGEMAPVPDWMPQLTLHSWSTNNQLWAYDLRSDATIDLYEVDPFTGSRRLHLEIGGEAGSGVLTADNLTVNPAGTAYAYRQLRRKIYLNEVTGIQ